MKDKKLIAFDMYATWVSAPRGPNPYKEIFSQLGVSSALYKELSTVVQTTDADIMDLLPKTLTSPITIDALLLNFQSNMDAQLSSLFVYGDFLPTINTLKQLGYQTAVISNISKPYIYPLIHLIPQNTFDYKILSYELGMQKPDNKIFDHLKDVSGYESDEIVMVGDSLVSDIQGAKNAHIDAVHIDRSSEGILHHTGYISISSLEQLLKIL